MKQFILTAVVAVSVISLFGFSSGNLNEISDPSMSVYSTKNVTDTVPKRDTTKPRRDSPSAPIQILQ